MPFTPIHMGPAALFKFIGVSYFSFTVFGYSQILIDLEPLYRLVKGHENIHGHSHSYAGAIVIGLVSALTGKYLCEMGLKIWNALFRLRFLRVPTNISWTVVFASAYIGTFSHVLLDSIMHADMLPWWPLANSNGLLYWISVSHLHLLCLGAGLFGGLGLLIFWLWNKVLTNGTERT